jgi:phospholipid/cholesterol/gamma-HCH transport system substrate-binding protein
MKRSTFVTWDQLKVGIVISIAILIMVVAVYKLGQAAHLFTKRYALVTLMPNASGLRVGGSVTLAGQIVGSVKSIDFLPVDADTTRNLRVVFEIDQNVREQVRDDSEAKLKTLGLLGDKVLDLSPGTPQHAVLTEGDTVKLAQSLDYEAVLAQASGAVDDMVGLTHDLREITGGIVRGEGTMGQLVTNRSMYDELTMTLSKTNEMIARLQNPRGSFGRMIDDPALYNNLTGMIGSVDSLVRAMASNEGTIGKLMRDDSLYTSLVGIVAGADSLVKMMTQGNGFAASMLKDQTLYDKLNKSITDLNAILEDVRKNPQKYTKGMIKVF